jgi:APA family basic amino acid/polyamine antiporter
MTQKNKLGLFDLTMIVVGLVIGMGIFRTSADAANASITPFVFFIAWFAGGVVALCGALTYAEIGSRFPATGVITKSLRNVTILPLLLRSTALS